MAFNRGDMDAVVASVDPQIEWTEPAESPGAGTYHGRGLPDAITRGVARSHQRARTIHSRGEPYRRFRARQS